LCPFIGTSIKLVGIGLCSGLHRVETVKDEVISQWICQCETTQFIITPSGIMPVKGSSFMVGNGGSSGTSEDQGTSKAANQPPVIIGETMARVEAAAAKIPGAKILNDMPDFKAMGMKPHEVTSAMMQYNRNWILEQLKRVVRSSISGATPTELYQASSIRWSRIC
jgi:hypothetical protein